MPWWVILIRVLVSTLLSGVIGLEREMHEHAAGLRTHILVCLGATLFTLSSFMVAVSYGHLGTIDPTRIAAGIVTGIGFLGAGAIVRYGSSIKGLTTAASIWVVAAIGLAVGAGMYAPACMVTIIVLGVLILSRFEEKWLMKKDKRTDIEKEEQSD